LIPIGAFAGFLFVKFWIAGYHLINSFFGCNWFMGTKLANIVAYATNIVCPSSICSSLTACFSSYTSACCSNLSGCVLSPSADLASISGSETAAGVLLAVFLFLLMLSSIAYVLSICSVGETLMFIIFKKKSDDDNILERKDEDDLEEEDEDDFSIDDDDTEENDDSTNADDDTTSSEENSTE
ncbi:MAG TPA: hypothetical protein QF484_03670, partial [Candidatus Marinimicrobia bacterium]|nr:hypothetical protein [Candidatus Neomarinimicrobiota bacterium]